MSKGINGFTETTFEFFDGLEDNNNRKWFDEHRDEYHEYARDPFGQFLEDLTVRLRGSSLEVQGGPDTMFRINRDVRFSKDKRPYSDSVSGLMTPNGTKNEAGPLLYLELSAAGGRVGGGMHDANATKLKPIRNKIIGEAEAFDEVRSVLGAADIEFDLSSQVATMPRGFAAHAEHRHADVIRLTRIHAMRHVPKSAWLDDTAIDLAVEAANALAELYAFLGESTRT